jgi:hypothetical protein
MKHLRTHEATYDGIRDYDAIDQEFGLGGDKNENGNVRPHKWRTSRGYWHRVIIITT